MEKKMYERLREYIDSRKISRKVIAITAGLSESQLSLLLSGKRRLTVEDYELICSAIPVEPQFFFDAHK